jgi:hypothetical protein
MIGLLEAEVHAILVKVLSSPPNRRPCPGRASAVALPTKSLDTQRRFNIVEASDSKRLAQRGLYVQVRILREEHERPPTAMKP